MDARISDMDWGCVFLYCGPGEEGENAAYGHGTPSVSAALGSGAKADPFTRSDVAEVISTRDGENDESNWLGVFRLNDGRFAFVSAGCDYTGWGCRESGHAIVSHSLEHLVQFGIGEEDRKALRVEHWETPGWES
ncbi:MAG TPA: hypothetical protein VFZ21_31675 [Gemmatimonadaceae bacterium]|nr:hypothetical protein [Gemmatimonadaceae bacterium]